MVSVIIPNYNHAPFLRQRIESVVNQSWQDFELIILDDASTDNSKEVIELYRNHEKVKTIIYNKSNSGSTFKQWEKGLALAEGKYIWLAESDDYCHEAFLESAIENLKKYNSSLHYCQSHLVDENNKILEHTLQWPESITTIDWKQPFSMSGKEFIKKALQYRNVIPNASAVVFQKSDVDFAELSLYRTAGDWLFWLKMLLTANISYSPEILNRFSSHSNTTRNLSTHRKIMLRLFEELAIKYKLQYEYHLADPSEFTRYFKECIDIGSISDVGFFRKFCYKFKLPNKLVAQFVLRKFVVNKYTGKLISPSLREGTAKQSL